MKTNVNAFHHNIEKWALISPKAAVMLPYVDPEDFSLFESKNKALNLKGEIDGKKVIYHDSEDPLQEAKEKFGKISLDKVQVLYVYGSGLGYWYDAAKPWLKSHPGHHLIFLEDDLRVIRRLMETVQAAKILKDPQVQLYYFADLKDQDRVLEHLVWSFMTNTIAVAALPVYQKHKETRFTELQNKLLFDTHTKNVAIQEFLGLGNYFYQNFYRNLLQLCTSYNGNALFGKFSRVPAIICGAGPSLAKQYEKIKGLEDRALIFAGGSSLNALSSRDILPHFGAGIDPFSAQLERLSTNRAYEVPFFYRNRMYHEAFKLIHGPRLFLSGAGGYDTPFWFEKELGLQSIELDEGFNVVNMCVEIAKALGCNPIIFVGMDLAYTGMQSYAPGVIQDAGVTKKAIFEIDEEVNQPIKRLDIYGKPVYTLWKWVAEAQWISDFSKNNPEIVLVNATEGGIGIPEIVNRPLDKVIAKYLQVPRDLRSRVHGEIENTRMPKVTQRRIINLMKKMLKSLDRSVEHLQILIDESLNLREQIKKTDEVPQELLTGRIALAETELADEPAYNYILDLFNTVYGQLMTQRLKMLRLSRESKPEKEIADQKLELQAEKCLFLQNVAKNNRAFIQDALKEVGDGR